MQEQNREEQNREEQNREEQEKTPLLLVGEDHSPEKAPCAFLAAWNENRGNLPRVLELSDDRRKKLQTRIRGGLTVERFTEAVKQCAITPFLAGKNERKWRADFDWLIGNDSNLLKVLEGKYGESGTPRQTTPPAGEPDTIPLPPHRNRVIALDSIRAKAGIQ